MLTDTMIRNTKAGDAAIKLTDGNGLFLEVRPNGSKLWRYRYRIDGKENLFALGEYCQSPIGETEEEAATRRGGRRFTLKEARAERERCRSLVKQGVHPSRQRRTEKIRRAAEAANTFRAVAEAWIEENSGWSENYRRQIEMRLRGDAFPLIGDLPIKEITPAHVKDAIKRVERRGSPASAKLLKTWIGGVFRYAAGELLVETDPTWPLRNAIKVAKTQHIAHLTAKEVPAFLRALDEAKAEPITKLAAQMLWLTVVRTIELRCAEWTEFDLESGVWTIPAERMKMREKHMVPLPRQALELLHTLRPLTGRGRFVFPGRNDRTRPITHEAIRDVFNRAGYAGKLTPHGVRGTFSTYFNEAGADPDLIEMVLAHKERNSVRRAYNHSTKLGQRLKLMQEWADLSDAWRNDAAVIPLHGKAA